MKIGDVDFPEPLLTCLRKRELVVFAGAGISMGSPGNLPDFKKLALQIVQGTNFEKHGWEQEDQFLGRLQDGGVRVHQKAAHILTEKTPQTTAAHTNILRLFTTTQDVRIVTTNFDLLFEKADSKILPSGYAVFTAPALPLGNCFQGLVHVHGSVNEPDRMVLTNQDFGRAYLTESGGWARRFLVDLFANSAVLFVGYSHTDTIMNYLTPAVPRSQNNRRFALVGERSDDPQRWRSMGINPIVFPQSNAVDFAPLDSALEALADHVRRGYRGWQREISTIADALPPLDDESVGMIEHALSSPNLIRYFVEAAKHWAWVDWLDQRNYLTVFFSDKDFTEQEQVLSRWLARKFTSRNVDALLSSIRKHGSQLHSQFWSHLLYALTEEGHAPPDDDALTQWVRVMMSVVPVSVSNQDLFKMGETCARLGLKTNLLQVYDAMTENLIRVHKMKVGNDQIIDQYLYNRLWEECLNPYLVDLSEPLLERTVKYLEERRSALMAWSRPGEYWDADSRSRSAIEPHPQDRFPSDIHLLIENTKRLLGIFGGNSQ